MRVGLHCTAGEASPRSLPLLDFDQRVSPLLYAAYYRNYPLTITMPVSGTYWTYKHVKSCLRALKTRDVVAPICARGFGTQSRQREN